MEKLIAKRPIQYMGRVYETGEPVPAYDGRMVEAWLEAGSVERIDPDAVEREAAQAAPTADMQAADALRAMGVTITDDTGAFVGTESLEAQIKSLGAAPAENADKNAQEGAKPQEGQEPTDAEKAGQEGSQEATEGKMLTGHLDAAQLERMTKAELTNLAANLGVDISTAKNNAERAAMIAAVEVQAPADKNGGAQ